MQLNEIDYNLEPSFKVTPAHLDKLRSECSDIVALYKRHPGQFFYRMGSPAKPFGGKWRKDRRPRDSSPEFQRTTDGFLQHMGFKALRSNSIFVSSNVGNIAFYSAQLYIIFPKDGFEYTWSKKFVDYYAHAPSFKSSFAKEVGCYNSPFQFQQYFQFTNKELNQALLSGNEVMMAGPYYRIPTRSMGYGLGVFDKDYNYSHLMKFLINDKRK